MAVSITDIREIFETVAQSGDHLLGPDEKFVLQEGSQVNGQAFRLFITGGEKGTGMFSAPNTDYAGYLGWTKNDAYAKLRQLWSDYISM